MQTLEPRSLAEEVLRVDEDKIALQRAIALVKMRAPGITAQTDVQSPCISVCSMSDTSGLCLGCFRTRDEIAGWSSAGDDGKRGVWNLIKQRMDGLLPSDPKNPP